MKELEQIIELVAGWTPEQIEDYALTLRDPADLALLERAVASFEPPQKPGPLHTYHDHPAAFARDLVRWPEGQGLIPYQGEILDMIPRYGRVSVRGPHGISKTATAALAVWWFSLTRDAVGEDWKIPCTASVKFQLERFLWPEIHKWYRLLRWDLMERDPVAEGKELLILSMRLGTGEAFSASPGDASSIEGAHAQQLMYVYDEAKAIPDDVFNATEGAFANAGPDTDSAAYALAISTPGEPNGRFYDIHKRKPGTEDWHTRHVRKEEAIAAGRMSKVWADQRAVDWGTGSALYQNRVEGEFASSDEDGVIPLAWVEAANHRWRERFAAGFTPPGPLTAVGVDCSGAGADRTVVARRYGAAVGPLERPRKSADVETGEEEMATAGRVVAILIANRAARAIIDAVGLGAGVFGRVREQVERRRVEAFIAGAATKRKDKNDEMGFVDCRAAAWWNMRELLDPSSGEDIALPPDDVLTGDLTAPHYKEASLGKYRVESKADIRKRLHRSTDDGDAVIQSFWPSAAGPASVTAPSEVRLDKTAVGRRGGGELRVRPPQR